MIEREISKASSHIPSCNASTALNASADYLHLVSTLGLVNTFIIIMISL